MMRDDLYSMLIAVDLMQDDPPVVKADASLLEALNVFTQSEIHHLPVVDNTPNDRLVGIITRSSLMEHYSQELRRKMSLYSRQKTHENECDHC